MNVLSHRESYFNRQAPCAMAGVFAIFISCVNPASEAYNCPSWSLSFFSGRYNSLWALTCSTILFRASLSKASLLPFSNFFLPTSFLTSSSPPKVGLQILLTEIGLHSVILFKIVSLSILKVLSLILSMNVPFSRITEALHTFDVRCPQQPLRCRGLPAGHAWRPKGGCLGPWATNGTVPRGTGRARRGCPTPGRGGSQDRNQEQGTVKYNHSVKCAGTLRYVILWYVMVCYCMLC